MRGRQQTAQQQGRRRKQRAGRRPNAPNWSTTLKVGGPVCTAAGLHASASCCSLHLDMESEASAFRAGWQPMPAFCVQQCDSAPCRVRRPPAGIPRGACGGRLAGRPGRQHPARQHRPGQQGELFTRLPPPPRLLSAQALLGAVATCIPNWSPPHPCCSKYSMARSAYSLMRRGRPPSAALRTRGWRVCCAPGLCCR